MPIFSHRNEHKDHYQYSAASVADIYLCFTDTFYQGVNHRNKNCFVKKKLPWPNKYLEGNHWIVVELLFCTVMHICQCISGQRLVLHKEHSFSHLSSLSQSIDYLSIKQCLSKCMLWAKHASYISACSFELGMEKWVVCLPSHMSRDYTMKQEPSALPRGLVSQWYMQRGWNTLCPGVSVCPRFLHSSVLMEAQMVSSDHVGSVGA